MKNISLPTTERERIKLSFEKDNNLHKDALCPYCYNGTVVQDYHTNIYYCCNCLKEIKIEKVKNLK